MAVTEAPWHQYKAADTSIPNWFISQTLISGGIQKSLRVSSGLQTAGSVSGPGTLYSTNPIMKGLFGHLITYVDDGQGKFNLACYNANLQLTGEVLDKDIGKLTQNGDRRFYTTQNDKLEQYFINADGSISFSTSVDTVTEDVNGVPTELLIRNFAAQPGGGLFVVQKIATIFTEDERVPDYTGPWGWFQEIVDNAYGIPPAQSFVNYYLVARVNSVGTIESSSVIEGLPVTSSGTLYRAGTGNQVRYFWDVDGLVFKFTENLTFDEMDKNGHADIVDLGEFLGEFDNKLLFDGRGDVLVGQAIETNVRALIVLDANNFDVIDILKYTNPQTVTVTPFVPVEVKATAGGSVVLNNPQTGVLVQQGENVASVWDGGSLVEHKAPVDLVVNEFLKENNDSVAVDDPLFNYFATTNIQPNFQAIDPRKIITTLGVGDTFKKGDTLFTLDPVGFELPVIAANDGTVMTAPTINQEFNEGETIMVVAYDGTTVTEDVLDDIEFSTVVAWRNSETSTLVNIHAAGTFRFGGSFGGTGLNFVDYTIDLKDPTPPDPFALVLVPGNSFSGSGRVRTESTRGHGEYPWETFE